MINENDKAKNYIPSFDPLIPHPDHVNDPYKLYKEMRENAPVYRSPHGVIILSRAKEIALALKDPGFGRGYFYFENMEKRLGSNIVKQPVYASARNMMVMKDGEDHIRLRKMIIGEFNHKAINKIIPFIEKTMDSLIENALQEKQFDIIKEIAYKLPSRVMCYMLGIPEKDWDKFGARTANGSRALEPAPLSMIELSEQNKSVEESREYFRWLVNEKKENPGEDLTTLLMQEHLESQSITLDDVIDNLRMMFVGGQETTVNTIGNGLIALYRHPEQLNLIRKDHNLITPAVNEIIRFDSSVQMTPRQARQDLELNGIRIDAGETLLCIIASANRDEAVWDDADNFDINRDFQPSFSFGGGPHRCIGAELACTEAEIAISKILQKMPSLTFDHENPDWLSGTVVFRGLNSLQATILG